MTRDEKRMIRREYINYFLHKGFTSCKTIGYMVREYEIRQYGKELRVYYVNR